jgi:hypothetical protein
MVNFKHTEDGQMSVDRGGAPWQLCSSLARGKSDQYQNIVRLH